MKKYISLVLSGIFSVMPMVSAVAEVSVGIIGSADGPTSIYVSETDYLSLEEALISVKEKITVPSELSEFESGTDENKNGIRYNFSWRNDAGDMITVSCDGQAHILDYEYYSSKLYRTDGGMVLYKREKAKDTALDFLKKIFPEGFEDESDILVYNADKSRSYKDNYGTRFNLSFDRMKNGIKVKDNSASVYILANREGMNITFTNINFDFSRAFGENTDVTENIKDAYISAYPMELVYESEYSYRNKDNQTKMVYRFKDNNYGYIKAKDGSVAEIDEDNELYLSNGVAKDEASVESAMGANRGGLTDEEIREIEKNKTLKTPDEAVKLIKSIPEFKVGAEFLLGSSSVYKTDNGYIMNISLNDGSRYINASIDAESGKLLSFNGIGDYEKTDELSDAELESVRGKVDAFLTKYAANEYKEVEFDDSNQYRANVTCGYTRLVNGIKYINNGISVTYDTKNKSIIRYSLNFDKNKEFENPKNAVDISSVYDTVFSTYLKPVYAPIDGQYELCYTVNNTTGLLKVDALTGKLVSYGDEKFKYSDIEKHWCHEAVTMLAEYGIGISGDTFLPDAQMTQEELLRFIANGLYSRSYNDAQSDALYREMILNGIIKEEEKNPTEKVAREEAFKYFTRVAGYGRIGEISEIYKVDFKDNENISEDYIGYAAILSGLNVISGFNGNLRPKAYITRAEAAMMIYNYLNCDK